MNLAELFPDEEHRFRMGLRPVDPAGYFLPRDPAGRILAERTRWLTETPDRYARLDPAEFHLFDAFRRWMAGWPGAAPNPVPAGLLELGGQLEPDVLFLSLDAAGDFRLRGGVLCFPTGWALEEKIGATVEEIHGVVPGLNRALGPALNQLFARLVPGEARQRSNWGLAATAELNLHPALARTIPAPPVSLDRLWLRVEEQLLAALPGTPGLVFALRIELLRLDELARDPAAAAGLAGSLRSLPPALAAYKRLDTIREPLIALLTP